MHNDNDQPQALKTYKGRCGICSQSIYDYHIDFTDITVLPADMDCGGDCWRCVADAEDRLSEVGDPINA